MEHFSDNATLESGSYINLPKIFQEVGMANTIELSRIPDYFEVPCPANKFVYGSGPRRSTEHVYRYSATNVE